MLKTHHETTARNAMTDSEQKVLIALVLMVDQYLDEYGDEVDSRSMWAGENAIEALAGYGLMEVVDTRFGRWTEGGNRFRREKAGIRERALGHNVGIKLVSKPETKE
jgi:hypothetical protein